MLSAVFLMHFFAIIKYIYYYGILVHTEIPQNQAVLGLFQDFFLEGNYKIILYTHELAVGK